MKHKVHVASSNKTKYSLDFIVSLLHKNFYSAQRSSNLINHSGDQNNSFTELYSLKMVYINPPKLSKIFLVDVTRIIWI